MPDAVSLGQIVYRFPRESGAEPVHDHGAAFAAFPAGRFEDQELLHAQADLIGLARDIVGQRSLLREIVPLPLQLPQALGARGLAQIGGAVQQAFEHRPAECIRHRQRQVFADRDGTGKLRKFAVQPDVRKHEHRRQAGGRRGQRFVKIADRLGRVFGIEEGRAQRPERIGPGANNGRADRKNPASLSRTA